MKRDPNRPKASDLSDLEVLAAVDLYAAGGLYPADQFPGTPGKVVVAKLHKLQARELISLGGLGKKYELTHKGRLFLEGA